MNFTNNEHLNLKVNYVSLMFSLRLTFYRLQSDMHVAKSIAWDSLGYYANWGRTATE